jgi:hypothetical protein
MKAEEEKNRPTEPGIARLEKTFDDEKKRKENDVSNESENPDEQFSDENKEKGIAKDMNNREREAEKIQEEEQIKNEKREIELNKKL